MIVLHHLAYSRSTRIIWALEELNLPYRLVRYDRTPEFKAPAALADIHPLGKAPAIEDGTLALGESSVILNYVNAKYGHGRLAPPTGTDAHAVHEEWLQYVESTAAFPIMTMVIGKRTGGLSEKMNGFFATPLRRTLTRISAAVENTPFLMGDALMLADIQMSYTLEMANHGGLLTEHPAVVDYLARLKAQPGCVKAFEIGGPMAPPG
jgi:glutathione S-transferase